MAEKTKLRNFIGGEAVDPAEGGTEDVINPATGSVIASAPLSTKPDVDAAVAAAKGAFPSWAATPPGERARALLRMADLIEERGEEIADLEVRRRGQAAQRRGRGRNPGHGRPAALLRRRRADDGGPRRRRVHGGPHLLHPP